MRDLLINADKKPDTMSATPPGLAGPDAPPAERIVDGARAGRLDGLWVCAPMHWGAGRQAVYREGQGSREGSD